MTAIPILAALQMEAHAQTFTTTIVQELHTATSSMTSVMKPLKFL